MTGKEACIFQIFSSASRENNALTSWHYLSCASIKSHHDSTRLPSWNTSHDNRPLHPASTHVHSSAFHTSVKGNSSLPMNSGQKSWCHPWFFFLSNPTSDQLVNYSGYMFQAYPESVYFSLPLLPSPRPSYHHLSSRLLQKPPKWSLHFYHWLRNNLGSGATAILWKHKSNQITSLLKTL